jgi:hypothetical protein
VAGAVLLGGSAMGIVTAMMGQAEKPPAAEARRPAPKPVAQAPAPQPQPPVQPAAAAKPAPAAPDEVEALVAATLTGLEKPGTTRAGPAILELGTMFPTSFWLKTYMPPLKEFQGNAGAVTVVVSKVLDKSGADLYDPANRLESGFFQRVSTSPESAPVAHLSGTRQVSLRSGAGTAALERVEGTLKLAVPLKPISAAFAAADAGKEQTVHGATVGLRSVSGKDAELRYRGEGNRLLAVHGYGGDGKPLRVEARYNWPESADASDAQFKLTFNAPVSRVEVLIAERIVERQFPFSVSRSSVAETPVAMTAAKTPVAPVEKPVAVVATAATVPAAVSAPAQPKVEPVAVRPAVFKAAPARAAPRKDALTKSAPTKAAAPPTAPAGPSVHPGFNDLMTAVLYRNAEGVNELLAMGKWPDKRDSRGLTPLMAAVMIGDSLSAEVLLKAGADPNLTAPNGISAGAIARERRDNAMQSLLERHGAR